jgi:hypothetical protein
MKEDFLHFVWQYKKFNFTNLYSVDGKQISIVNTGQYLQKAGPDFFNAQLIIDNQKWAGNVEIHLKSSDWYVHHHETDLNYDNVVLHVVWEHDTDVFRKNNTAIPVVELKKYVSPEIVANYHKLTTPKSWINCENEIKTIDDFTMNNWQELLFIERLQNKSLEINHLLLESTNDWEAVFYCLLAKSFGLNTNGISFLNLMKSIPFSMIRKESHDIKNLEALFFGRLGLLDDNKEDVYFNDLKKQWNYLAHKYSLKQKIPEPIQFFKHRPDNFPTIRLAQLAQLIHLNKQLFQKCLLANSVKELYSLFNVNTSYYWKNHYIFDRESPPKNKSLSKNFIDLIILNCIVPIKFCYAMKNGNTNIEELISLVSEIASEKNSIIDKFKKAGINSGNSFQSQALLQLKKEYCNYNKCLNCEIGQKLINFTSLKNY